MAANEGIRSPVSVQPVPNSPKCRVYEYLHLLNQSLQETLQILKRLEKCPGLRRDFLRSFQLEVQELRAETNFELTERLSECEQHDWGRLGKLRREWERQFEDPDDVYLKATQREVDRRKLGLPPRLGIIPHSAIEGEEKHLEAEQRRKKKLTRKGRG